jgi:DNA (cytosine-5)-methyltransferase 1
MGCAGDEAKKPVAPAGVKGMGKARPPELRLYADEGIADNFAGGGGASTGIELGLGRSPDYACNHDPEAIAMHEVNHPETEHFCEDIWKVDPREA